MPLPGAPNPLQSLEQEPSARLSSYFEKRQKKQGPTSLGDAPVAPSMSSVPAVSAPSASAGAAPRGSGGKSPTGFVGFEQYFGANAPAVQKMTQGAVASAAAPRPTMGQQARIAPPVSQSIAPRGFEFSKAQAMGPTGAGGFQGSFKNLTGRPSTEQQIAQAKAGQERLKTLGEPGGYQAQAQYSPELKRFDAMLMGGMLPQQAKAEASRLGALERRLTEQLAGREEGNRIAQAEADARAAASWAKSMAESGSTFTEQELLEQYGNLSEAERQARLDQEKYMADRAQAAKRYYS